MNYARMQKRSKLQSYCFPSYMHVTTHPLILAWNRARMIQTDMHVQRVVGLNPAGPTNLNTHTDKQYCNDHTP
jgi:hypothetical protein